jgi:serine/threonine protein kinase
MKKIWEKYIEIEKIGSGNYGKVIKAKNKVTGKYVAIKEINKSKYDNTNQCLLENIKYINSENSISIIEIIDSKDYLYIVMELCLISLDKYMEIRNKGLLIEEINEILIQLNKVFK